MRKAFFPWKIYTNFQTQLQFDENWILKLIFVLTLHWIVDEIEFSFFRAQDVERWRKQLEKTLAEVNAEIAVQHDAKEACERALEAKALPHDVVTECLSTRETRRQFEVVRDPVEHSLNDENLLIGTIIWSNVILYRVANLIFFSEKIRSILKMKCEDAWAQLNRLDDIRQKLEIDLQDKTEALRIDIDQIELTERSSGLSHKPDPTKVRYIFT